MKNGMIRIGMFEAYLERMLIRGLKVAYISYFTRTLQERSSAESRQKRSAIRWMSECVQPSFAVRQQDTSAVPAFRLMAEH